MARGKAVQTEFVHSAMCLGGVLRTATNFALLVPFVWIFSGGSLAQCVDWELHSFFPPLASSALGPILAQVASVPGHSHH